MENENKIPNQFSKNEYDAKIKPTENIHFLRNNRNLINKIFFSNTLLKSSMNTTNRTVLKI